MHQMIRQQCLLACKARGKSLRNKKKNCWWKMGSLLFLSWQNVFGWCFIILCKVRFFFNNESRVKHKMTSSTKLLFRPSGSCHFDEYPRRNLFYYRLSLARVSEEKSHFPRLALSHWTVWFPFRYLLKPKKTDRFIMKK